MTQPITVYPTETPGLYRDATYNQWTRLTLSATDMAWCIYCLQLLEVPSDEHWDFHGSACCKNCVVVADEGDGP